MIKEIKANNLVEKLEKLEAGGSIFISFDNDVANTLKLFDTQIMSYNNLFMSYVNNTCEEANMFNLQQFLDKYTEIHLQQNELMRQELLRTIGEDNYNYILENNIFWMFNLELSVIQMRRLVKN